MPGASRRQGFTLIELLTVIAIIAILVAILFPIAGTVQEQARGSSCLSKLHQIYVSTNVYKMDEGGYPPTLMGFAERNTPRSDGGYLIAHIVDPEGADSDQVVNRIGAGIYRVKVPADRIAYGFLYNEQVKDINLFKCPDNLNLGNVRADKDVITVAHFPPRPGNWPSSYLYVGDVLASVCGTDSFGTIDCYNSITQPKVDPSSPLFGRPKYYFVWDSYDIGPRIGPDGKLVVDSEGNPVFDVHYSTDWTGTAGLADFPAQLKYANPPSDKTILAYCTWHEATARTGSVNVVLLSGTAKKISTKQIQQDGPNAFNR